MRILGIDPGSENTGYGIIESDGSCHSSVAWGTVRTQSRRPFQTRLLKIYAEAFGAALENARAEGRIVVELAEAGESSARFVARW